VKPPRARLPRRLISLPTLVLVLVLVLVIQPPALFIGGLSRLRPGGRGRVARVALAAAVYTGVEIVGLGWSFLTWLRLLGRSAERRRVALTIGSYALLLRLLDWLYRAGKRVLGLRVVVVPPPAGQAAIDPATLRERPLIALCRHAGVGDSFLFVYGLLRAGFRPRIVLKDTLAFDPALDVVISRLPHLFVTAHNGSAEVIARLVADAEPGDVLVIFPEGGTFTPRRRLNALAWLRRNGPLVIARDSERLRHVLPPRTAGVRAALVTARHPRAVILAHRGLDHLISAGAIWRGIPLSAPVEVSWWSVDLGEAPLSATPVTARADSAGSATEEFAAWLLSVWSQVDRWVGEHPRGG
jgi:1-acyl-sn-glycerol-3-phosphate acyltransferase